MPCCPEGLCCWDGCSRTDLKPNSISARRRAHEGSYSTPTKLCWHEFDSSTFSRPPQAHTSSERIPENLPALFPKRHQTNCLGSPAASGTGSLGVSRDIIIRFKFFSAHLDSRKIDTRSRYADVLADHHLT